MLFSMLFSNFLVSDVLVLVMLVYVVWCAPQVEEERFVSAED
jgi:hypothetical protein